MNLDLTEEQKLLQKSVREFAESEVKPLATRDSMKPGGFRAKLSGKLRNLA